MCCSVISVCCVLRFHYCALCFVCRLLFVELCLWVGVDCVVCDACCMRFVVCLALSICVV